MVVEHATKDMGHTTGRGDTEDGGASVRAVAERAVAVRAVLGAAFAACAAGVGALGLAGGGVPLASAAAAAAAVGVGLMGAAAVFLLWRRDRALDAARARADHRAAADHAARDELRGRLRAAEASATLLEGGLQVMGVAVAVTDDAGRVVWANDRFAACLERSRGTLQDGSLALGELLSDGAALPAGGAAATVGFRTSAGRRRDLAVRTAPIETAGGARTVILADDGGTDGLELLFDVAPVPIAVVDADARFVRCNRAFCELLDSADPAGRALAEFVRSGDWERLEKGLRGGDGGVGEAGPDPIEVALAGDRDVTVAIYHTRLPGEWPRTLLCCIETTHQKALEQQFVQSQKMQAVGQLAGGIAHDFNNLLTAMIGFCDLLLQRHRAGDQSFADIMQIKQNANRAARLVRQLLAFSRQQTLEPRLLDVTDVLAELANLLRRLLGEKIELEMAHGQDLGLVKVDQGQLDQTIINLAVNARDAMPRGGRLTIRTGVETLERARSAHGEEIVPGRYVTIAVRDTGLGISPANLSRIFDPFFTTKEVGRGTGLGLSTVYGIVKQTGGYVRVQSDGENTGAIFTLYFPRFEAQERDAVAAGASDAAAQDVTGGGTVLLVEDEDPVRLFSARALRGKGYKVVEARNGESALEILQNERFDLLITDMVMPKVDGATVIQEARRKCAELPVICISGYTDEDVLREVESLENVHFLSKPFSLKQLAGKVKEAIERR